MVGHSKVNLSNEVEEIYASAIFNMEAAAGFASLANQIAKVLPSTKLPHADIVIGFADGKQHPSPTLFESSCTDHSLVTMLGVCEQYLRHLTFLVNLGVEQSRSDGPIQGDVVGRILDGSMRDTSALWTVFESLLKALGRTRHTIKSREWFASLDRVRNCLVHRAGLVGDLDVNNRGVLEASWRKTSMIDPEGHVVTALPFKTETGGEFRFEITEQTRSWKKGERIKLSVQDCHDMAYTLGEFCGDVKDEVSQGLRELLTTRQPQEGI